MTRLALTDALFLLIEGRQQPIHVASLQVYEKSPRTPVARSCVTSTSRSSRSTTSLRACPVASVAGSVVWVRWSGSTTALNITVLSYVDQLAFGLIGCRTALPHLQRLLDHLTTELDDLDKLSLG